MGIEADNNEIIIQGKHDEVESARTVIQRYIAEGPRGVVGICDGFVVSKVIGLNLGPWCIWTG